MSDEFGENVDKMKVMSTVKFYKAAKNNDFIQLDFIQQIWKKFG